MSGAQLRELRDRKRAQRDVAQEEADGARMPPPPPRPKPSAPAEFHPDSQMTQVQTPPHQATTEPSVNQQPETTLPREHSVTSEYHAPRPAAPAKGPEAEVGDSEAGAPGAAGASLPKGFFENAQAQSKALGEKPPSKEQMAEEYADFMRQVESESAAVATQQAAEDEDQAAERRERDAFEQLYVFLFVRLQRLEALKEAARQRAGRLQKDEALEAATAALYDASAPVSLGEALSRSEKRRKLSGKTTTQESRVTEEADASGSSDDEELSSPTLQNWRTKSSSNFK
ncbi:hypothetical protein QBZ16_005122 [Prototheca wickerhamii]|uniref:Uncharacterized protein n=1 Tax=Prototheca wickerhamii TaxID=3111 RepID=A0AAD9IEL1_PROWI|nr:hypothetical protein QBZ16_005122 [Prototheca wickerhamii]